MKILKGWPIKKSKSLKYIYCNEYITSSISISISIIASLLISLNILTNESAQ